MDLMASTPFQGLMADLFSGTLPRLALAAFLGGLIGLERQLRRRPAGLRTNMFICFGAAMYTILSFELTKYIGLNDQTRIAAQIIPGIGFIGAGSILHAKSGVSGLTTAATLFVVASIGMACGGGLYLPAIFATVMIFAGLLVLGWLEKQFSLKPLLMHYRIVSAKPADAVVAEVNMFLYHCATSVQDVLVAVTNGKQKIAFSVEGTRKEQKALADRLRQSADLHDFEVVAGLDPGE
ncbi:MAG TPA: MgtC/SapB family protein [Verrucomicrobiae bacterium]|nr:MgtC/SapB family protein [Verrucomicrobiae bacterium]